MINLSNTLKKKNNKKGFTLIELIVVIAILGILAAIAIPRLTGFQDSAKQKADIATGKTLATAAATLIADQKIAVAAKDIVVTQATASLATGTDAEKIRAFMQSVPVNKHGVAQYIVNISATGDVEVYSAAAAATTTKAVATAANRLYPTPGSGYGGTD